MIGRQRRQPGGKERRREALARHCPSVSFRAYASSAASSFLLALYCTVQYRTVPPRAFAIFTSPVDSKTKVAANVAPVGRLCEARRRPSCPGNCPDTLRSAWTRVRGDAERQVQRLTNQGWFLHQPVAGRQMARLSTLGNEARLWTGSAVSPPCGKGRRQRVDFVSLPILGLGLRGLHRTAHAGFRWPTKFFKAESAVIAIRRAIPMAPWRQEGQVRSWYSPMPGPARSDRRNRATPALVTLAESGQAASP